MVAKMHRLHLPKIGEGVIYLPGGVPFEADDDPRYPAGAFMRLGNKEFIYAISGGTIYSDNGVINPFRQKIGNVAIAEKALIYATVLKITSDVSCSKDELAGGEVVVFVAGANKTFTRGIISNNEMTGSDTLVLQLDSPIPVEVVISGSSAEVMLSPYSGVLYSTGNDYAMVMGMPTVPVSVSGKGLWLQVSGPAWCAPRNTVGAGEGVLEAVFNNDGGIGIRGTGAGALNKQHAGVVISTAKGGTSQGAPFVMLQIAH